VSGEELHWYETDELENIPSTPGLYAWYAVPVAGPPDWQIDLDAQGRDQGGLNFGSFLANHTRRLRSPTLDVDAKGHLWSAWRGSLTETGTQALAGHLERLAEQGSGPGAHLRWALQHAPARELLASVLVEASPRLSAPIYIGVARNLRERLGQHVEALVRAAELLGDGTALTTELRGKFGGRAVEAGLSMDELRIAALPMPEFEGLAEAELRRIVEAAEFVLNRWHHPLFGER
jgi:hypothetical protein